MAEFFFFLNTAAIQSFKVIIVKLKIENKNKTINKKKIRNGCLKK